MTGAEPIVFAAEGDRLVGIIHHAVGTKIGLLIVVGGPQYRIGAHRQYVHLARASAAAGFPAMRFDYRGIGDSEGRYPGFEAVEADIAAAIETFRRATGIDKVVLWGLCEGASAIALQKSGTGAVAGLVLVNPWVRTEAGLARAYVKHYYRGRLRNFAFWRDLLAGRVKIGESVRSFFGNLWAGFGSTAGTGPGADKTLPYPERMRQGLSQFRGPIMVLLSGRDLVAREFEDHVAGDPAWSSLLGESRVALMRVPQSDHTFSSDGWREDAAKYTIDWMRSL